MRLEFLDIFDDRAKVEAIWQGFSSECEHSYFQSWGWIESWLDSLPRSANVKLAVVRGEEAEPAAAFFLGHQNVVNQNVFRSRAYVLNQTGKWEFDRLYIEHNLMLRRAGSACSLTQILGLLPPDWEEFYLSALDPVSFPGNELAQIGPPYDLMIVKEIPCPYVDLEEVRKRKSDYLALLSGNVRSQIKRSYKLYEAQGPIVRQVAADVASALDIYDELIDLHTASWAKRNKPGAFATAYFRDFHRRLIEKRHAAGEIQLIRVKCGERTIGCVYNFVFRGKVYFYQSGLASEEDNKLKPGYLAHAEAVKVSAEAGHTVYDFLAGVEDYKQRLSTNQRTLVWARVQKPRIKFKIERFVRQAAIAGQARYQDWKRGQKNKAVVAQG